MYVTVRGSKGCFLQPQLLGPLSVLEADTKDGTVYLGAEDVGGVSHNEVAKYLNLTEAEVYEVSVYRGYLARTSAPGYLDCTDWCGFTNKQEAMAYLRGLYAD